MYVELYHKPQYLDALEEWGRVADEESVNKAELALRWGEFHSALNGEEGGGLILGASSSGKFAIDVRLSEKKVR